MEKLLMSNQPYKPSGLGLAYPSGFLAGGNALSRPERGKPEATDEEVRFTVWVDDMPFEFVVTRQALEDIGGLHQAPSDLLAVFVRNRDRLERIALDMIDHGVRWPHLVIRMHEVREALATMR
jgi:hypothetical protein